MRLAKERYEGMDFQWSLLYRFLMDMEAIYKDLPAFPISTKYFDNQRTNGHKRSDHIQARLNSVRSKRLCFKKRPYSYIMKWLVSMPASNCWYGTSSILCGDVSMAWREWWIRVFMRWWGHERRLSGTSLKEKTEIKHQEPEASHRGVWVGGGDVWRSGPPILGSPFT